MPQSNSETNQSEDSIAERPSVKFDNADSNSNAANPEVSVSSSGEELLNATTSVDANGTAVEFIHDGEDGVMIGVEIFEESDLETDTENKLQLYSVDATVDSSDAVIAVVKSNSKLKRKDPKEAASARLSLEERVKCIRMCSRYNTYADAQKAWRQKYGTEPPCRKTLSTLDKKFEKTGSVADLVRCGRPKTTRTEATIAKVEEAVKRDPSKSIRSLAKELGITQASVHRIKKDFEDKKNTLKTENKKLKEKLNDALKRIIVLERKVAQGGSSSTENNLPSGSTMQSGVETFFLTSNADSSGNTFTTHLDGHQSGSNLPTIIALNSSSGGHISMPSVLRLQQPGQDVVHIITLPQASSSHHHQLLSLDDSSTVQLSVPNDSVTSSQVTSFQTPVYSMAHETYSRL